MFLESPKEEEWSRAVAAGLHPAASYVMVRLVRLVGMMLLVYTKQEHEQFITNVAVDTVGTGIMGKLGNKATVTCHLPSHWDVNQTWHIHIQNYQSGVFIHP